MSVLTRHQASSLLGITERQIDRLIKSGHLARIKAPNGNSVRITQESMNEYLAKYKPWLLESQ